MDILVWELPYGAHPRDAIDHGFFHGSRGVLARCDITREESLSELSPWIEGSRKVSGMVPIVLLVNTHPDGTPLKPTITQITLMDRMTKYDAEAVYICAKTGLNVGIGLDLLAQRIFEQRFGGGTIQAATWGAQVGIDWPPMCKLYPRDLSVYPAHERVWRPAVCSENGLPESGTSLEEVKWTVLSDQGRAIRTDPASGIATHPRLFRCLGCAAEITDHDAFPPGAFIHTCTECRKTYQDSEPFPEQKICSVECRMSERRRRLSEAARPTIQALLKMIPNATSKWMRENELRALERFNWDPQYDELVHEMSRDAIWNLSQPKKTIGLLKP